jgi:cytochrome d ubiquinol oxidase subunit I
MDATLIARAQFAFTISFHILFPAFTIGLASYLAVLEALYLATKREAFHALYRLWIKVFAVTFAMGVVSGIVLSYQFGTNWSRFSDMTGNVVGPLMAYEVLTAFFLEAGFLGIMLFGEGRVPRWVHFAATCIVAAGTLISAFWILSANSWMQTPTGYTVDADGRFMPADWWQIVFNPSFPYRFVHMVLAAYLSTAFAVGATGAWHLRRTPNDAPARIMFSMAMWMAAIVAPIQILAGDQHGLNTLAHQPAKIAAMEGHFETQRGAPLILFGWPDMDAERTRGAVEIPKLGSLILTHEWDGEVKGLKDWPKADRPSSPIVFWSFRLMVGIGTLMALMGLVSLWLRARGRLYETRWFHRAAILMGPSGFIAVLAGWVTTEVGRQPWVVYGLMRTADAASPVSAAQVATSLALFIVVYGIVFVAGTWFLIRLMTRGTAGAPPAGGPGWPHTPMRPISAAEDSR